ncbi:nickel ABC transporter substrate-binding protein [Larsenimonas rhizosphaerae]|uniref:Nickel ABC transporter substrate-binding protein n=1 Tax=Larsenimonas rhizosphaerae TaxID=2944682 RepID=A0AA41ZGA0_9GAMM|nr:nickel ABC transporter substrate-binding protein [Larsenimonas rhizosphaerae]MCX2524217.1 nickel ABC transporter substrate-binding protein [Larsenimonas rhizosphaerae]
MKQQTARWVRTLSVMVWCLMAGTSTVMAAEADSGDQAPVLRTAWPYDVGPLNSQGYGANQMVAQAMVYEPLVRYHKGEIEPWLATDWALSEDGRTYTFTLRQNVTFSDGTPFDASAVKANVDAVLGCRARHDWLALVNQLDHVTVVDAHTVQLVLKHPYYPTLMELSLIRPLRIASPNVLGAAGSGTQCRLSAPVGTGPWVFSGREPGRVDHFRRNAHYWGTMPAFSGVDIHVINDPNTRAMALETGQIDMVQGTRGMISVDSFQRLSHDPRFTASRSEPLATRTFVMNSKRFPTNALPVRQAIEYAVDRPAIVKALLYGAEPVAYRLFSSRVPYADIDLPTRKFDPARARSLLEKAGWTSGDDGIRVKDGQRLTLSLYFDGEDPLQKSMSQVVQANLRAIGIEVRLQGEEEGALMKRQKNGHFNMIYSDTWGAPYEPHAYLSSMRVPAHADYQAQQGLPMKGALDRDIGRVLTTQNPEQRQSLYRDILTTLHDQAIYLPISFITSRSVSNDRVSNVHFGDTMEDIPFADMTPAERATAHD